jgi:hypothetical protein
MRTTESGRVEIEVREGEKRKSCYFVNLILNIHWKMVIVINLSYEIV